MKYDQKKVGKITVIRIREKAINAHKAPNVKTALLGLILEEGEQILINLQDVESMDSTGLGTLLFAIRQAEQHEKEICFCAMNLKIKFLVRIAQLEQVVDLFDSEEEALKQMVEDKAGG